ncbi:MAG: hypothetical protein HYY96_01535 [Candidatus Tectomicrobia bacterium]|nr:hypothetical protein [Candidatus Tectomicrobia bacterium]
MVQPSAVEGAFAAPLRLLAPDDVGEAEALPLAARPASFEGRVLGILDNRKHNSERLLLEVGELLRRQYRLRDVRLHKKPSFNVEVSPELLQAMVQECDLVVTGIGD